MLSLGRMATSKQIAANRRNAQRSTGPTTPQGKARSSRNAFKHGLTAQDFLVGGEEPADYAQFAAALRAEHDRQSTTEDLLLDQLISAAWRLQRVRYLEHLFYLNGARDSGETGGADFIMYKVFQFDTGRASTLDSLARHESRLERSFHRALQQLQKARRERPQKLQNEPISGSQPIDNTAPPAKPTLPIQPRPIPTITTPPSLSRLTPNPVALE